jgi:hypothetical protein
MARRRAKCDCGCGQAPAETTRLRKASCPDCGYIVRLSRECISRGLPVCPCGLTIEPECLHDLCAEPGELGAAAYLELRARETDSAIRSDNAKRRRLGAMRCASCKTFRPFGANCDPSAAPDPCPRCGSTEPVRFQPRERTARTAEPMPF